MKSMKRSALAAALAAASLFAATAHAALFEDDLVMLVVEAAEHELVVANVVATE